MRNTGCFPDPVVQPPEEPDQIPCIVKRSVAPGVLSDAQFLPYTIAIL
jgi:hypothetical protein